MNFDDGLAVFAIREFLRRELLVSSLEMTAVKLLSTCPSGYRKRW